MMWCAAVQRGAAHREAVWAREQEKRAPARLGTRGLFSRRVWTRGGQPPPPPGTPPAPAGSYSGDERAIAGGGSLVGLGTARALASARDPFPARAALPCLDRLRGGPGEPHQARNGADGGRWCQAACGRRPPQLPAASPTLGRPSPCVAPSGRRRGVDRGARPPAASRREKLGTKARPPRALASAGRCTPGRFCSAPTPAPTRSPHPFLPAPHPQNQTQMIPLSRIIELSVVTAFYAGICYMLFDGACAFFSFFFRARATSGARDGRAAPK
jgi:hypothetical protein